MCKCYLYIVCTLVFCQKEFLQCSITALTAREHRRHGIKKKKRTEQFAFYTVSLKFGVFRGGVSGNF